MTQVNAAGKNRLPVGFRFGMHRIRKGGKD